MAKRKTITVNEVVDIVNAMLKDSAADAIDVRIGASQVLEQILMKTGNYSGFRYLLKDEVKDGAPGINYLDGCPIDDCDASFKDTDASRIHYFG